MRRALLLAGLMLALTPCSAQVSERAESVRVAVYHSGGDGDPNQFRDPDPSDGLAFITETRTIDVPAGPATIELRGVASTIVPQTAAIDGLPVPLLEQNFDYDLLSPGSLIGKSIGETVTLVRTDKKTGKTSERTAVLRTGPDGAVLDFGGNYEAFHCSALPERLVFPKIPDGLRDTPTLSIRTNASQAGRYTIKLSYIATSVNWAANYVARIHPDGRTLDLSGWVTLTNGGETSFKDAPLDIVAGRVARVEGEDQRVEPVRLKQFNSCWPTSIRWHKLRAIVTALQRRAGVAMAPPPPPPRAEDVGMLETVAVTGVRAAGDLGDYKLYSLNGTTDVLARQTKLVQLLDRKDVPFQRVYYFTVTNDDQQHAAAVALRMKNATENHLGLPLPAGMFAVTQMSDEGSPVLLARQNFRDYSVDSPIELEIGQALDVYATGKFISEESIGSGRDRRQRGTAEFTLENHKNAAIDYELRLPVEQRKKLVKESAPHAVTANGMVWSFHLAAGESKIVRLTVETVP